MEVVKRDVECVFDVVLIVFFSGSYIYDEFFCQNNHLF